MNTIKNIRTNVFQVSQEEFARIAGVNQGTISRWERGAREPDLDQMKRIRETAASRGIKWDDALFFDIPTGGVQQERDDAPTDAVDDDGQVSEVRH